MVRSGKSWASLQIAGAYFGTVVGAGFASGQEILRFFALYGYYGIFGLLMAMAVLALYGVGALRVGEHVGAENHRDVLAAVAGRWLGSLIDWVITGFLFAGTGVMIAGAGAIFVEQFGLPELWGNLAMAAAAAVTVAFGFSGVVRALAFVAPLLITSVVGVALHSLPSLTDLAGLLQQTFSHWEQGLTQIAATGVASPHWALSGLLYASYNLLLAIPILAPLGATVTGARHHWLGGLLGGLGLGLTAFTIQLALVANLPDVVQFEVPMIYLAGKALPWLPGLYAVVLWAEIYTTAVAGLFGVTARLVSQHSPSYPLTAAVIAAVAVVIGRVGFAELVLTLYPLVGYLGFIVLLVVPWYFLRRAWV